jgi:hypothetical protein
MISLPLLNSDHLCAGTPVWRDEIMPLSSPRTASYISDSVWSETCDDDAENDSTTDSERLAEERIPNGTGKYATKDATKDATKVYAESNSDNFSHSFVLLRSLSPEALPQELRIPDSFASPIFVEASAKSPTWLTGLVGLTWLSHLWQTPDQHVKIVQEARAKITACLKALQDLQLFVWSGSSVSAWMNVCHTSGPELQSLLSIPGKGFLTEILNASHWLSDAHHKQLKTISNAYDVRQNLRRLLAQKLNGPIQHLTSEFTELLSKLTDQK